ncbi:MAG: thymidine phosphorylase [Candidatus Geothermincolales bacterium]
MEGLADLRDLLEKKVRGQKLAPGDWRRLVQELVAGRADERQVSALLMAALLRGMDGEEAFHLTMAMVDSGKRLDLSSLPDPRLDKHSTGGIGDAVTLVLVPWLASCGATVVKLSGASLGFTGGTLDKLRAIPGFRTELEADELLRVAARVGAVIAAQGQELVPADKKLYFLRDLTCTVESPALIASSVMSKKIAAGADVIALDVKVGTGAFMGDLAGARELARLMVEVGRRAGKEVFALISSMDQPLAGRVGCALEVMEALEVLRGELRGRLFRHCLELGADLLVAGGISRSPGEAQELMMKRLESGHALERMARLIEAQGGNAEVVEEPGLMGRARREYPVLSERDGYIRSFDGRRFGWMVRRLAGYGENGRPADLAAGAVMKVGLGERVERGQALCLLLGEEPEREAKEALSCFVIGEEPVPPPPLVIERVR